MSEEAPLPLQVKSTDQAQPKQKKRDPIPLVIAVLLTFILIAQVYSIVDTRQQRQLENKRVAQLAETAASIKLLSELQDTVASDLFENYQKAAYDNPQIERITEQQLIATEFQLLAAQMLSMQNQAIINLLALQYELPDEVVDSNLNSAE